MFLCLLFDGQSTQTYLFIRLVTKPPLNSINQFQKIILCTIVVERERFRSIKSTKLLKLLCEECKKRDKWLEVSYQFFCITLCLYSCSYVFLNVFRSKITSNTITITKLLKISTSLRTSLKSLSLNILLSLFGQCLLTNV